jgi:hypothetical protein
MHADLATKAIGHLTDRRRTPVTQGERYRAFLFLLEVKKFPFKNKGLAEIKKLFRNPRSFPCAYRLP